MLPTHVLSLSVEERSATRVIDAAFACGRWTGIAAARVDRPRVPTRFARMAMVVFLFTMLCERESARESSWAPK